MTIMDVGVLITGVGSGSTGEQVLKALRLGRHRYTITVANVDPDRMVVADDAARRVLLPPAHAPSYVHALATAANDAGAQFIVPGSNAELLRIVAERGRLSCSTDAIPLVNNSRAVSLCRDKQVTADVIRECGFGAPATVRCSSVGDALAALADGLTYPVVLKPRQGGGGSAGVCIAQDEDELRFFVNYALQGGAGLVLQQYVGTPEHEYTVGVLHSPDGALLGSVAMRRELSSLLSVCLRVRNRRDRPNLGEWLVISSGFTQGEIGAFSSVQGAAEQIASKIGSTGPLNIQGRLVGDAFLVFEINPRFSGSSAMRAMAGFNEPEGLIDWHLGALPAPALGPIRPARFIRSLVEYPLYR